MSTQTARIEALEHNISEMSGMMGKLFELVSSQQQAPAPAESKAKGKSAKAEAPAEAPAEVKRNLDPEVIDVEGTNVSFMVFVEGYMLPKAAQQSARVKALTTDANGKVSQQRSFTPAILAALVAKHDEVETAIDTVNKRAKLGKYAPQPVA